MKVIRYLALAGCTFALACGGESDSDDGGGGSGGGTPGVVDTGLPEDTPLEDVTAEQYANACESLREDVRGRLGPDIAVRGVCEVYGAALSDSTSECNSAADTCETRANGGGFSPVPGVTIARADLDFTMFECNDVGDLDGCSVTVGEFETCLEDQMSGLEELMAQNNCDNAADVDLTQAAALADLGSMAPPSCARVQQECPGVGPFGGL